MSRLHIDIESFSRTDLKKAGAYRYAECDSTEIICAAWALGDEPPSLWVPHNDLPDVILEHFDTYFLINEGSFYFGPELPACLQEYADDKAIEWAAHNAPFERTMFAGKPGQKLGFPVVDTSRWVCTAAKAAAHALPRNLFDLSRVIDDCPEKSAEGKTEMLQLCKVRKPSKAIPEDRFTVHNAPEKFIVLFEYCIDDVQAERGADKYVPDLPPKERVIWRLDQKINERGVGVDLPNTEAALTMLDEVRVSLDAETVELCGIRPSQTARLAEWIREEGYAIPNLQAATMRDAMAELKDKPDLKHVRTVLQKRALRNMKAPDKFAAILRAVCEDSRLRGMFMYHQATTGRWSSVIVQLQNLFRSVIYDPETAVEILGTGDIELMKMMYKEHPMRILSSLVRSLLIADEGKELLCQDYSSIEGRVCSWFAGQEEKLEVFRTHGKVYEFTGAQMNNLPTDLEFLMTMKKTHPDERQQGKQGELLCQFQGGWKALVSAAVKHGIPMDRPMAEEIVNGWRATNKGIVRMWENLEKHAREAVAFPGKMYKTNNLYFKVVDDFLYMRLPSGRRLAYYKPRLSREGKLTFLGTDTYTRRWGRIDTYGGRLTENAVQATARDIMTHGMVGLETNGFPIIGTVHDEIIMEVDHIADKKAREDLMAESSRIMCDVPEWAEGIPVSAGGFMDKRYRKDND